MIDHPKRLAFFLPNTFTALNLACGFGSVIMSWNGQFYNAGMILLLGSIFDSVDGRVARMTGTQSQFGEQFDSISDVVSFGIAPAFLAYNCFFKDLGRLGMVISFIYLLCGSLRLARFNANIEKVSSDYFQGLPIPTAALGIVGYVLLSVEFEVIKDYTPITIFYVLLYSLLMISNIPFYSFKNSTWVKTHKKRVLALIFLLLALIFTYEQLMIGAITGAYVLGGLVYFATHKGALEDVFSWKNENEHDEED
ncbi:CDP-diacylglycerol--serine O-phosphatidyltransferase [Halobacteriovorax marinus]|uniref:CDP-diacylglycerol--serine O-phosphatidyltransferase n=1 Tax=Halobacteriovorax marinus TaxID=97084 RepID=A0A1Y5FBG5_9BACT|nr:CDP-diacylglycerol--serine O-phosphatidyltransferase [Halobacteriovorax marinus]